jgi:signal transduction histidine kinase
MKIPRIGLYSRFFALFGGSTFLLAVCIALGTFAMSEEFARNFVKERHQQLDEMLTIAIDTSDDVSVLKERAKENRVQLMITRGNERLITSDSFPDINTLLNSAEKIESLYFVKYKSKYYLLAKKQDAWIAVTSTIVNLLVYPRWLLVWPWLMALFILYFSYLILRRLLQPVADATKSSQMVSRGDFSYRIKRHPKTELAELTHGLNRMAAKLQQLFDAKSDLLLAISHELRTPLGRMSVSLAMLENTSISTELKNDIKQMDTLIEQLLEGERLQHGHKILHLSTYYLPTLLQEVLSENGLSGRVDQFGDVPEEAVEVDVGRIKFLLRNLLKNAIEHTAEDTVVALTFSVSEQSIYITVSDDGPGINSEDLTHLFEPFYCAKHTTHRDTKGAGLGLYLCQRIAQAHNGELLVDSVVGEGSKFTLLLPQNASNNKDTN